MDGERGGVPGLRTKLIAISILHRRIHAVESVLISYVRIFRRVHAGGHLIVHIKLPRRLPVEGLGLVTVGAGRA